MSNNVTVPDCFCCVCLLTVWDVSLATGTQRLVPTAGRQMFTFIYVAGNRVIKATRCSRQHVA